MLLVKELLKQWMTARFLVKMNIVSYEDWVTAALFVTKTDILL